MCFAIPSINKGAASDYLNQFGNWLSPYTQTIKDKTTSLYHQLWPIDYYGAVLGRQVSSAQMGFFLKAQQNGNYQTYRQWSSKITQEIHQLKIELLENIKLPADLKAYLADQFQQGPSGIISPLFYQRILAKLKTQLAKSSLVLYYQVIIEEAEENFRKVLQENSETVLNYFYHDLKNHIIEIAGGRYSSEKLLKQLNFYQGLVFDKIYLPLRQALEEDFATGLDYKNFLEKLDLSEPASHNFSSYSNIAITTVVAVSAVALGLYATAQIGSINSYSLLPQPINYFNLPNFYQINLVPPAYVVTSVMFYYGSKYSPAWSIAGGLSALIPEITAQIISNQSPFFMTLGGAQDDTASGITKLSDGSLAVTGYTESFGIGRVLVTDVAANGTSLWAKHLGRSNTAFYEQGHGITALANGHFVIVGRTLDSKVATDDVFVTKITNNGTLLWSRTLSRALGLFDEGLGVTELTDNSLVLTGYTSNSGVSLDAFVIKLTANGDLLWARRIGESINIKVIGFNIIELNDGLALAGYIGDFTDALVIKLASNGTVRWARTLGGPREEDCRGIISLPDDSLILSMSSRSFGNGSRDGLVARLTTEGDLLWARIFGEPQDDDTFAKITSLPNGNLALTGSTNGFGAAGNDVLVVKFTANGILLSANILGGPQNDIGYGIAQLSNSSLAVTIALPTTLNTEHFILNVKGIHKISNTLYAYP